MIDAVSAKTDIMSLTETELREFMKSIAYPAYRADQLFAWMHRGCTYSEMTNIPASLIEKLRSCAEYRLPTIAEKYISKDGTRKYLFELIDGECVESVFMKYEHGNTVCVSSQAGCRMGCKFCASTLAGKVRNLTPSEILGQIAVIAHDTGERVGGVVMMGIGEPLDNYDNVIKFLRLISSPSGLNIGLRHISLSTCGLVDKIDRLAGEGLPITLSVSLHASDDMTRSSIMPVNNKYNIEALLAACKRYFEKTGRRVSFEYTLIANKNDSRSSALALAARLRGAHCLPCHVNLIMLNEVAETGLASSGRKNAEAFRDALISKGINATIRRRLGSDINASCGQLRLKRIEKDQ